MNFTPTKEQTFVAALRSRLHNRIAKRGLRMADIYFLKKIYLYEATRFFEDYTLSVDLLKLTDILFGAATLRALSIGKNLFTSLCGRGEYTVNVRLFEIAVSTLASAAENGAKLCFFVLSDGVLLTLSSTKQKPRVIYPKSVSLYCAQNGRFYVFLPLEKSAAKNIIKNETEYLTDRYSAFNVFNF